MLGTASIIMHARALDMKEKGSSFARPTSHLMVCEFSGKILVA
jgi:hypothetical protein